MENLTIHASTGKLDDSFVGIKIKNDRIDFYYPETYDLSSKDDFKNLREDIIKILGTISIAKTYSNPMDKIESSLEDNADFAIRSYLWIIRDYLINGFYINREKVYKINQNGRVNWKRTLENQPIISNGNVIYTNIVVETKNKLDNLIVEIHKYTVKKSIDFLGWLFGLNSKFIITKKLTKSLKLLYVATLKKEIDSTFDDYKKIRLRHMLNVIQGLNADNNENEFVYGVDSYEYVYERMIDSIFGNTNTKDFNPKSTWNLVRDNFKDTKPSSLRPDTILINNDIAYILDAKFYRFGATGETKDLPTVTSIQKQITYGEYMRRLKDKTGLNVNEIYNAFLLPFNLNKHPFKNTNMKVINNNIMYVGYAKSEWKDNIEDYQYVYSFLIDLKHVIMTWNENNHDKDISELIDGISNAIINTKDTNNEAC